MFAVLLAAALAAPLPPELDFVDIGEQVLVEPSLGEVGRRKTAARAQRAREAVSSWFGERRAKTTIVVCTTAQCRTRLMPAGRSMLAPGEHGAFRAIIDGVEETSAGFMTHELAHAEVQARKGDGWVASWFDEGVASLASGAPECSTDMPDALRNLRSLDAQPAMFRATRGYYANHLVYCQCVREVARWAGPSPSTRVVALLDAVRAGEAFDEAYGPLATQPSRPAGPVELSVQDARIGLRGEVTSRVVHPVELGSSPPGFTLALWTRRRQGGVLAHLSEGVDGGGVRGGGWCSPLLGFDEDGALIAQVLPAQGEGPRYRVVRHEGPTTEWMHVAMIWQPGRGLELYRDGRRVGQVDVDAISLPRASTSYLTWGSSNLVGAQCWSGAIVARPLEGSVSRLVVLPRAITEDELAALTQQAP